MASTGSKPARAQGGPTQGGSWIMKTVQILREKLFQIIRNIVPVGEMSEEKAQLLAHLNPDKFDVEIVGHLLDVSYPSAKRICETAVRQGLFERSVEVKCPDGQVAASAESEANLPQTVRCWVQKEGHWEQAIVETRDLERTTFYRLNDKSDSVPFGQTA